MSVDIDALAVFERRYHETPHSPPYYTRLPNLVAFFLIGLEESVIIGHCNVIYGDGTYFTEFYPGPIMTPMGERTLVFLGEWPSPAHQQPFNREGPPQRQDSSSITRDLREETNILEPSEENACI